MTRVASERPSFFEGQYLGADDLESVVGYLRDHARRHALGGHTWGIAAGLDLIEQSSTAGEVDVFLLPGYAWDGYGRVIVNTHPVSLSLELMKGSPTGLYEIWIWYRERGSRGVRPGFETCGAEDAYERTGETFGFAIGPRQGAAARSGGVTVADSPIPDPREALTFFDPARGVAFDASVPHQQLEEAEGARWLVPVGKVSWVGAAGGAAGHFAKRTEDELRASRSFRRHAGLVAEGIQAADGLIRLRGRETAVAAAADLDQVEGDAALRPGRDFDVARGPTAIDDLVWIEGNARGIGHHRLWGTKLELRNIDGGDDKVPLYLRRAPAAGLDGTGRDLEIAIGDEAGAAGRNRLVVGTTTVPQVVVNDRGQVGIGALDPRVFHENARDLVIARDAVSGLTIKSGAADAGHVYFADGDAGNARDRGRITYHHGDRLMSFGVEGTDFVHFTEASQVGIGTDAPGDLDSAADDLVIQTSGNTGMTLVSGEEATGSIFFATSADDPMSGFITYDHDEDAMRFGTAEAVRVTIRSDGDVGVGVDLPRGRVHVTGGDELELAPMAATPALVLGPTSGLNVAADHESIQARSSSSASPLGLQPLGGRVVVHGRAAQANQVVIDNIGRIGLGTNPSHAIHVRRTDPDLVLDMDGNAVMTELVFQHNGNNRAKLYWERLADRVVLSKGALAALSARDDHVGIGHDAPDNPLHVKGARSGNAANTAAHVALIENTDAGTNADVLALKIGRANAGSGNNFVTFFAGANAIGRIEGAGSGNSVSYVTSGADFAEWLPRAHGAGELGPGDVVGIRDGKVSRDTQSASALGVISDRAGFVGNSPTDDAARSRHALVALVGQLPVRVAGPVRAGDFLIPSGRGDGTAIAVTAEAIVPAELGSVLGRAWTATTGSEPTVTAFVSMTSPVEAATARACAELDRRLRALEPGGRDT